MEPRQLLAANPLYVGAVYIEEDVINSDFQGDTFELTFEGGAPGTELTRIEINGDQNLPGFGVGDVFFDTANGGLGADQAFSFSVISLSPPDPHFFARSTVQDGTSLLVLDLISFQAGDKLTFSIDVDEVEGFDPNETDLDLINDEFDPITSGVEFQGSLFTAHFSAPHYHDAQVTAEFRNRYDDNFAGSGLGLSADDEDGKSNRTDGAIGQLRQDPLPVAISGTVYLETNLDLVQDPGEGGIPNVELGLWERDGADYRFTGHRTTTDVNGDYRFGFDLDLDPGTYQVRETQPGGLFSVGAIPGTADGNPAGQAVADDPDVLTEIDILLGGQEAIDLDFAEALPAEISGHVYHDRDNDGNRDVGEEGIGDVPIQVIPIQTIAAQGPVSVATDSTGYYEVTGLAPGTYRVVETEQPDGYLDGLDAAGTVNGLPLGSAVNPGDNIETIFLGGGQSGIDYDFGELMPVSIEGRVLLTDPYGDCYAAGADQRAIEGATVRLLDSTGNVIDQTLTDVSGSYRFDGLFPGTYTVVEVTPAGLIDGADHVGTVDGSHIGAITANDTIADIVLTSGQNGIRYDFCEHRPASLSGHVYHDRDNDGRREAGEEGIGSVRIALIDSAGNEVASTSTDQQGYYEFTGLAAGVYTVVETHPGGWVDGLDAAGTIDGTTVGNAVNPGDRIGEVDLQWGDHGVNYDFGELRYATIQGSVVLTTPDGDCYTSGSSQRPLAGVTILLQDENGTTIAQTTTDAQGDYHFDQLMPGTYTVVEITPGNLIDGADHVGTVDGVRVGDATTNDTIRAIELTSGQAAIDYDFCEHEPACLSGYVYHDENDNGVFESQEDPIAGATVRLLDSSDNVVGTTQTDANGFYQFCGLRADTYTVVETQPTGYLDGTDAAGTVDGAVVGRAVNPGDQIQDVQLRWGDDAVQYNFGELLTGSIEGFVHTEFSNDCVFDATEDPIAGVTVELLDAGGRVIATTQTDNNGHYRFDDLTPGVYTVREQQPAGYFHVGQRAGSGGGDDSLDDVISAIAVGSDESLVEYNFCEVPPSSIEGTVHTDLNGDCVFDPEEQPLSGVTIELIDENGNVVSTTQTDAQGHYRFDNLRAGTYEVRELQPAGYLQGSQRAGSAGGNDALQDLIFDIPIGAGVALVNYDFCEVPPSSIGGRVHLDTNRDCVLDANEQPLAGVTIRLLDANGNVLATERTDIDGRYHFDNLAPGVYSVEEEQPDEYFHGGQRAGSGGGNDTLQDLIFNIPIGAGVALINYDFCELPPSSIGGRVHLDTNRDCVLDAGEQPLEGVTIRLLDANGNVQATARTDTGGRYHFDNLAPGVYSVEEEQPDEYFHGNQSAGSHGGDDSIDDVISAIAIPAGEDLVAYDFCETPPGRLSGYVFQDGDTLVTPDGQPPSNLEDHRDGTRTADDTPLAGVVLELRDGISGDAITGDQALPGFYGDGPIRTVTDANGFYEFRGLPRGNYAVYEIHPEGYFDGIDTPGTTSGIAINPSDDVNPMLIQRLSKAPENDAIILIPLPAGGVSADNNFSEVIVERPPWIPPETPERIPEPPPVITVPVSAPPVFIIPPPAPETQVILGFGGTIDYTWHLSVVDGGTPRGDTSPIPLEALVWRSAAFTNSSDWQSMRLRGGRWTLATDSTGRSGEGRQFDFGIHRGIPVAGDFNGDGIDEVAIYYKGRWFLDLNGNGRWDDEDLWAQLGDEFDLPVTGDWNGDGKDDIGIFGPAWLGDPRALAVEHGLPDLHNITTPVVRPKNVPPELQDATDQLRYLQRTPQGDLRADVIDHVFHYGNSGHIPVTGDWTGDGIKNIGIFRQGRWMLDADGDGRWSSDDWIAQYGRAGDLPVIGDFDGDGIDEIGVFRSGQWIIDINGNRQLDAHDKVFQMGEAGDRPVAGDWNGDGTDDPAVYRDLGPEADSTAKAE